MIITVPPWSVGKWGIVVVSESGEGGWSSRGKKERELIRSALPELRLTTRRVSVSRNKWEQVLSGAEWSSVLSSVLPSSQIIFIKQIHLNVTVIIWMQQDLKTLPAWLIYATEKSVRTLLNYRTQSLTAEMSIMMLFALTSLVMAYTFLFKKIDIHKSRDWNVL